MCCTEEISKFDFKFFIPIIITIVLAIWNLYQQVRLNKLQKENDKKMILHKLQFEKEFNIYNDLWKELVELRTRISSLRPIADSYPKGMEFKDVIKERLTNVVEIYNPAWDIVEKNRPFYGVDVYDSLMVFFKLAKSEFIDVKIKDQNSAQYWEQGEENVKNLLILLDSICEEIRKRIGNIEVK